MASDEETLYCLCRRPYEEDQFMIECEVCNDWFHGSCVNIKEHQSADIEIYHCPNCQTSHGPLVLKKRRNWHRRDYSETDENVSKAVETGTVVFIRELKHRTFPSADDIPLPRLRGYELTREYLNEHGFDTPILIEKKDGLDLRVPPPSFTIQDVENHVGSMREITVIDVARQEDCKMLMREWTEYYNSPNRSKIYNVISLEFTNTKLAELVEPPRVVTEMSWVSQYWPQDQPPEDVMFQRPEVQRYCLMGVKDSFTDFHVDFGGTSVWYHVIRGEKVFYLIRPTPSNMALYEDWVSSSNQSEMFFGDQVDYCYCCVVKQGQTLFIPTGWIHAVLTPIDSLVFGGNFLHSLNIDLQIQVYEIERRVKTESKYLFPNFETVHWYAAKHILDNLKDCREDGVPIPRPLVSGAKSLVAALKSWTRKKDYVQRDSIPETIQYGRLLRELGEELKLMNVSVKQPGTKPKEGKPKKEIEPKKKDKKEKLKKTKHQKPESTSPITAATDNPFAVSPKKSPGRKPKQPSAAKPGPSPAAKVKEENLFGMGTPRIKTVKPKTDIKISKTPSPKKKERVKSDSESVESPGSDTPDHLKMRMPKFGAYHDTSVYDFSDEPDETSPSKLSPSILSPSKLSPSILSPSKLSPSKLSPSKLSPKLSSKLEDRRNSSPLKGLHLLSPDHKPDSHEDDTKSGDVDIEVVPEEDKKTPGPIPKLKVCFGKMASERSETSPSGKYQMLSPFSSQDNNSDTSDEDEADGLVVDETPKKQRRKVPQVFGLPSVNLSPKQPLKLKLSVGKAPDSRSDSSPLGSPSTQESQVDDGGNFMDRLNMPTIRGGLNGSISDILEASGYGTETDFKTDEDINRASPTMRDAIQGMLSMSRIGAMSTLVTSASAAGRSRLSTRTRRPEEEGSEKMPTCFKDEEYVYPTLDVSDTEADHVFKPRGRPRKDETWNPKAKLNPNCPKPERPHREGVVKESVHSGLAAVAAKYAHLPPPKRQYIRRKPKQDKKFDGMDSPPSTSSGLGPALEVSLSGVKRPAAPPTPAKCTAAKKPRKGMATAKQRLGKILKIHKMMH